MENRKVSVIVLIYQVEKYIAQCLESLRVQTYSDLEILMIDDGSSDHSLDICHSFMERDTRFVLYQQENKGIGMARNLGVQKATGDFICFVDGDDYVHPEFVEILWKNLTENHGDVSMCDFHKTKGEVPDYHLENTPVSFSRLDILKRLSTMGEDSESERVVVVWNKMIRAEIMKQISFVDRIHEDEFLINELILRTECIVYTNARLYYYRQRADSTMGVRYDVRHLDVLEAYEERIKMFDQEAYASVKHAMVKHYFQNAIYWFWLLKKEISVWTLKRKWLPDYVWMFVHYHKELTKKEQREYLLYGLKVLIRIK